MSKKDMIKIHVTLTPETWIIAPVMPKEQLLRYARKGWIDKTLAEHLDRAFPRNSEGKPIIFKMWLDSPMKKALAKLNYTRKVLDYHILDERGLEVEYIVIPDKPLVYRRVILNEKPSTETFEYIDSTFDIRFTVLTKYPKMFMDALVVAGRIGLMSRTKKGFGKFSVKFNIDQTG